MRERGSALLTAVIAVMVMLLVSGVFFSIVNYQSKIESSEERSLKAYYLAQAGVNYGVAYVLQRYDNSLTPAVPDSFPSGDLHVNPFGADYGGKFTVYWTDHGNDSFTVTAKGEYPANGGVERTFSAFYKLTADSGTGDEDGTSETGPGQRTMSLTASGEIINNHTIVSAPITNKNINEVFSVYIFITNEGTNIDNGAHATELKACLVNTETNEAIASTCADLDDIDGKESSQYTTSYNQDALVKIRVTGKVYTGNAGENFEYLTAESGCFKIGSPTGTCSSSGQGLIWESETP